MECTRRRVRCCDVQFPNNETRINELMRYELGTLILFAYIDVNDIIFMPIVTTMLSIVRSTGRIAPLQLLIDTKSMNLTTKR
jgi:hypothetical protein